LATVANATRTTSDGRQYPAARKPAPVQNDEDDGETEHEQEEVTGPRRPVAEAMNFAQYAIAQLDRIKNDDPTALAAFGSVENYIEKRKKAI
jgi:hypothetical protein